MDEQEPGHYQEIDIYTVLNYAPHCAFCDEEIIDGSHVLAPVTNDETQELGYTALCYECAKSHILGGLQNEQRKDENEEK